MSTRLPVLAAAAMALIPAITSAAGANPRDSIADVSYLIPKPVTEPAAMAAWLRLLAGSYRVEGMVDFTERPIGVGGKADCKAVGTGPGIQCIFNITWPDEFEVVQPGEGDARAGIFNLPGGDSYLDPSMMLIGLEPARSALRYLLVDNKGLPEGGPGFIVGKTATFRTPCVNARPLLQAMNPDRLINQRPPETCARITRIETAPESRLVYLSIYIEINDEPRTRFDLTLRRQR
jgi:hypothetical protein